MNAQTNKNPWLSRYAAATAVATLGLICAGGLVTSHGAGLAVPDWPTTYGYNMFFFPISRWTGGIFYEHTHRLIGSLVGFMTIILAAWLWVKEERRWMRWLGALALLAVTVQGVLGGLRVTALMPQLGIFHAALAQMFFTLVAAIALFTSRWWMDTAKEMPAEVSALRRLYIIMVGFIFVQLVVAATMRHEHAGLAMTDFPLAYGQVWPDTSAPALAHYNELRAGTVNPPVTAFQIILQMVHRILALGILCVVLVAAWKTKGQLGWKERLAGLAVFQAGLLVVQVALGAATIWTNKSADITTIHVGVGAISFMNSVLLVLVASRGLALQTLSKPQSTKTQAGFSSSGVVPA